MRIMKRRAEAFVASSSLSNGTAGMTLKSTFQDDMSASVLIKSTELLFLVETIKSLVIESETENLMNTVDHKAIMGKEKSRLLSALFAEAVKYQEISDIDMPRPLVSGAKLINETRSSMENGVTDDSAEPKPARAWRRAEDATWRNLSKLICSRR